MRKQKMDFSELVRKNKEALLRDKEQLEKIEQRLEARQMAGEKQAADKVGAGGSI